MRTLQSKRVFFFGSLFFLTAFASPGHAEHTFRNSPQNIRQSDISWQDVAISSEYRSSRDDLITKSLDRMEPRRKTTSAANLTQNTPSITQRKPLENKPILSPKPQIKSLLPSEEMRAQTVDQALNEFEINFELSKITYREPTLMKETGQMYGLNARFTHHRKTSAGNAAYETIFPEEPLPTMYRVEGRYAWGSLDYDSQGTGSRSGVQDQILEIRALAGYDVHLMQKFLLTPYAGLGFRYLYDDLRGTTTVETEDGPQTYHGYRREQQYVYLPIGIDTNLNLSESIKLTYNIEYDLLLHGRNVSHIEDVVSDEPTLTFHQSKGYGLRTNLNLNIETSSIAFFIEPFLRYWNINESEHQPRIYSTEEGLELVEWMEPKNSSTEYGIKLGLKF